MQRPDINYNHKVIVFATDSLSFLAVASSDFHLAWNRYYGGSLKTDISYSIADVFETFPFPAGVWPDPKTDGIHPTSVVRQLENVGRVFCDARYGIMVRNNQGLTATLNRFHNPEETSDDFVQLRDLYMEMNQAVAAAYEWAGLDLGHDFHNTSEGLRFTISEYARREVLQRLLKLNHERYAEEVEDGGHGKKGISKKATPKRKTNGKTGKASPALFEMEEDDA